MYNITKQADHTTAYVVELVADSEDDIQSLPTYYEPGSSCLVINPASVYILSNEKVWVKLG